MNHPLLDSAHRLSDAELLQQMDHLAARERHASAELVAHLAEVESRALHLQAGHASSFEYCRRALCFSEHEAYNRCAAARAARRFPVILDLLADGSVNLTTVRLLAGHLTTENHRRVLDAARGKRKGEVEEIVATLAPRPDAPTSVRRLPNAASVAGSSPVTPAPSRCEPALVLAPAVASATGPPRPLVTAPLAPDRYRLQVTIGGETLEKLRLAADMLGHAVPTSDGAAIIDRALTALLGELARKKFAATERPRRSRGTADAGSRHIPAAVKRAVWVRDLGRCAFAGTGGRCDERRRLEFHHVTPYAVGGPPTVGNIQLRCRGHNQHESRAYFGPFDRYRADEVSELRSAYRVGAIDPPLALPCYPFQNGVGSARDGAAGPSAHRRT